MSNEISNHFGAYLEIVVNKMERTITYLGCNNNHKDQYFNKFCSKCGQVIIEMSKTMSVYPTMVCDDLLDEKWEDVLGVITPQNLYGKGTIIAVANLEAPGGEWLIEDSVLDFPTEKDIEKMKTELLTNYADIIKALQQSNNVSEVSVKTGYVLIEEY